MDLLGSILDSMEKPPQLKQDVMRKKQQEKFEKLQQQEKEKLRKFRSDIEKRLVEMKENVNIEKIEFESMEKLHRTIVHDTADKHGLIVYSFGIEGCDRHCVVYKKEFKPSDKELEALRRGIDPYEQKLKDLQEEMQQKADNNISRNSFKEKDIPMNPNSNYKLKYANLIGLDAGEAAAKATKPNEQFGMVPSSNKRDLRSIEQILDDNRKKRRKE
ncbi:Sperm-associated antigen 7 -like protein [Sarcoptes scabiei]|uniref:Sperm-associated antigen 7 -like protein n=1 Tax=Sarcoptes scabiei TaxID=52283 RepID=A0A834R8P3_SARSC|nr:Sperm-associated antigen 7 -like protein [Sarcoptes scabiei]